MSEESKNLEQEFQEAKNGLDTFLARNQSVIDEFRHHVELYNSTLSRLRSTAKSKAGETGKVVSMGLVMAKPHMHPVWDLDKVAEILPDKLFREAVRIDYKLLPAGVGEKRLLSLEAEYPKLKNVKGTKASKIDVTGPDEISLKGLEAVG